MNYKKVRFHYITLYLISYVSFSFVMTNLTPFLSRLGYNTMERGLLLSAYAVTTILFQLVSGIASDVFQTIKKIIIACILVCTVSAAVLFNQNQPMLYLQLLLVALAGGLVNTLCGLYDTWVVNSNIRLMEQLSFIKAFGSIGWAIGSMVTAYIISMGSYLGIVYAILGIGILMLVLMVFLPDIEKIERKEKIKSKDIIALFTDKTYCLLLVILFLMYSMVVVNNCTVIDKMLALNASDTQISLKWSLQSILEIPTYVLGPFLLKKFKPFTLLRVSAAVITMQFLLFGVCQNSNGIILLSVLQMFSTPLILVTSKTIIHEISDEKLRGSSQLVALSVFTGVSSLIIPTIAGMLCISIGIDSTLLLTSALGIIALILIAKVSKMVTNKGKAKT